jgi:hypothetical protein
MFEANFIKLPGYMWDHQKPVSADRWNQMLQHISEMPEVTCMACEMSHFNVEIIIWFEGIDYREMDVRIKSWMQKHD